MKKSLLFILAIATAVTSFAQTIPNAGFELGTGGMPTGWSNKDSLSVPAYSITGSNYCAHLVTHEKHSGSSSLAVFTDTISSSFGPLPLTGVSIIGAEQVNFIYNTSISTITYSYIGTPRFAVNTSPDTLKLWAKYKSDSTSAATSNGIAHQGAIGVGLTKWVLAGQPLHTGINASVAQRDTIGYYNSNTGTDMGLYPIAITTSTVMGAGWSSFAIPITHLSGATADSAYIGLYSDLNSVSNIGQDTLFVDDLAFASAPTCSGTPTAGTTASTANTVCSGVTFTLSLSGASSGVGGLTYQWQSSPNNSTYSNIGGATNSTYMTAQTSANYYRCAITCTNSSLTATSTPVNVTMNTPSNCYCSPTVLNCSTYAQYGDYLSQVSLNGSVNMVNNTGNSTSSTQCYTHYSPVNGTTTTTLSAGSTYSVGVQCDMVDNDSVSAWIDFNNDGSFSPSEMIANGISLASANTTYNAGFMVPGNSVNGTVRMRVILNYYANPTDPCGTYSWAEVEDYDITIHNTPCLGTPTAGTTASTANTVCSGVNFTLSLPGASNGVGLTYQWQSSPNNSTYSNIGGATNSAYITTQTSANYYRCIINCTSSSLSATSTPLNVTMNAPTNCYCTPPASTNACALGWITNVTTSGGPYTFNHGSGCSASSYADYSGIYNASNYQFASTTMSLTSTVSALAFSVWIDYNDNGVFELSEQVITDNNTGAAFTITDNFTVPGSATIGTHKMRVRGEDYSIGAPTDPCAQLTYGETEDYAFTVIAALCTGTPTGGTTVSTASTVCSGTTFTLSLSGASSGNGFAYQWQSSPNNVTYSNIGGASNPTFTTNQSTANYYRCVVTCISSSLSATSTPLNVTLSTAPSISSQPSNSAIFVGANTSFSVAALGTGISYQWQVNTGSGFANLTNSGVYNNVTTTTMTITNATLAMSGYQYLCVITGACSPVATSNSAILTVTNAPLCTGTPTSGTTVSTAVTVCSEVTFTLSLSGESSGSGFTYQWQSSTDNSTFNNIASATSATYTTNQATAKYYRCVLTCSSSGLAASSSSLSITMAANCITGITEYSTDNDVKVYPNPTDGHFNISLSAGEATVIVNNVLGDKVYQTVVHNAQSEIDLSAQPNGIYFLQIITEQGTTNKKIIISH